jgi:phosphatidylglycerol:prolipoprotein diacylglycerol transferase
VDFGQDSRAKTGKTPERSAAVTRRTARRTDSRAKRRGTVGLEGHDRDRTLTGTVPTVLLATITLDFDPFVRVGDSGVRLDTIALAGAILAALAIAALLAARTTIHDPQVPAFATAAVDLHLRRDDLLFIVLGVIPGAVIGGRLGYVLIHLDYYTANPTAVLDPNQGSLELGLAVLVGTVTGAYVGRLLDAPVGRWLHVAAIPMFVGLALGELSRVLGGGGQGSASDASWATAYAGPGPWDTLVPATPAHPAQVYGALAALVALAAVGLLLRFGGFRTHDGSAFFVGLLVWALGRSLVTFAWRDDVVVGPLRAGALVALGVAASAIVGLVLARLATTRSRRQAHGHPAPGTEPVPDWPDPATRPRF